jgi:hypothetical protein
VSISVADHLPSVPPQLASAISETYRATMDHFLKMEWDDAQVDAGRFCEAALRYLELKLTGSFTPIDGKSKPNRGFVAGKAKNDTTLPPSLRAQMPQSIELVMDFRNNRNSAHLGDIDANKMDAACVVQIATWVVGEILRIETNKPSVEVQAVLDKLAERHVPLVQMVGDRPVVLAQGLLAADRAIVLLYQQGRPVPTHVLREWAEYAHASRWRTVVLRGLARKKFVHVTERDEVALLHPGESAAQRILLAAGGL